MEALEVVPWQAQVVRWLERGTCWNFLSMTNPFRKGSSRFCQFTGDRLRNPARF
ncbi:hypothetical protein ACE103_17030 [Bradyrhizobium sp. ma5]|uniref:hypothetical protein n=1 Tax=Bradyrhizobium sp. ma5 TaxID=3344828 RepID=UPI0035D3DD06